MNISKQNAITGACVLEETRFIEWVHKFTLGCRFFGGWFYGHLTQNRI